MRELVLIITILIISNACSIQNNEKGNDCTDSDGRIEIFHKGTLIGKDSNNQTLNFTDYCWNIDGQTLLEYYCDGESIKWNITDKCECGCSEGACLIKESDCFDDDPDNLITLKGYASIDQGKQRFTIIAERTKDIITRGY